MRASTEPTNAIKNAPITPSRFVKRKILGFVRLGFGGGGGGYEKKKKREKEKYPRLCSGRRVPTRIRWIATRKINNMANSELG